MGFAQPLMLAFLGLFIPVILLYLLKQRRRRMEVATLMFWDKILKDEQTVTSLTRLKKLLSLLLQLAFIALLTASLARPLLSDRLTGTRRLVVLMDTSASMFVTEGDSTRFELAREQALDLVKGLAQGDTLMLVAVNDEAIVAHPFTNSKRDLEDALNALEPTHTPTDFAAGLAVVNQLPPSESITQVYLITDGAFEKIPFDPPEDTQFAYLSVGSAKTNIGITAFQVRPLPDSPRDFEVHLEMTNGTDAPITAPLELRLNGALTDAYEVTLPAQGSVTRSIRQYAAEGGTIEMVLDYDDAFPIDNVAYGRIAAPDPIRVQLVMEQNLFLESALLTDANVALELVAPGDVQPTDQFDVTIYANAPPTTTPTGNSIFIHQWPEDLGIGSSEMIEQPIITDWDREHPVNRHLALQNVAISRARKTQAPDGYQALVSSFDDPLLLLKETEQQRILVIPFDPMASDLPLRVAFPIMIANAIRYLNGTQGSDAWMNPEVGQAFAQAELETWWPQATGTEQDLPSQVRSPDGETTDLDEAGSLVVADRVGLYYATEAEEDTPLFAVNLTSTAESRIESSPELPITSEKALPEIRSGFRLGYEPWFFVALVAVILSLTEWILYHRRLIE